jgi:hypothetical protein
MKRSFVVVWELKEASNMHARQDPRAYVSEDEMQAGFYIHVQCACARTTLVHGKYRGPACGLSILGFLHLTTHMVPPGSVKRQKMTSLAKAEERSKEAKGEPWQRQIRWCHPPNDFTIGKIVKPPGIIVSQKDEGRAESWSTR